VQRKAENAYVRSLSCRPKIQSTLVLEYLATIGEVRQDSGNSSEYVHMRSVPPGFASLHRPTIASYNHSDRMEIHLL
jgi:hypothetical protein